VPGQVDGIRQRAFYHDIESCINVDRPKVVLDCSKLSKLDSLAIHLLLCCLEEAMKRNGDVRLAALQTEAKSVLMSSGLDQIFQAFDSVDEAVESFRAPHITPIPAAMDEGSEARVRATAA
jgi:anti-anti-sigma factor